MYTADYFINKLGLEAHVEGGYFKEVYRNELEISTEAYSIPVEGERALSTTIYFLLKSGQVSKFHKLKFDELWFYHYGCPVMIHMLDEKGGYQKLKLGLDLENGEMPQVLVPANVIFSAEPLAEDSFSFVSCLVSPGFDFRDFILYDGNTLSEMYPEHEAVIRRFNG